MPTDRTGPVPEPRTERLRRRDPQTRRGAVVVALAVAVVALVVGLTPLATGAAGAAVAGATVSVSKTTGIAEVGETVTVNGTGFDPAAHVGTRPPLAGKPSGVYLIFGRFGDPWKPSAGAPTSAREALSQKWVLPAASRAILDPTGTSEDYITLNADGSFTAELDVAPGGTSAGAYAIATYAGSGAVDAAQETLTPISFAPPGPTWDAQITVSKTTDIAETGETVTVTGTGFDPAAHVGTRPPLAGQPSGFYVVFGRFGDPWKPSAGAPTSAREALSQKWVLPAASRAILDPDGTSEDYITLAADGSFTAELAVAPGGTSAGSYAIATYAGSGAVDATQETLTPISFAPPGPTWDAEITVSKTTDIAAAGETVTVTGTGFDPAAHVGTRPPLAGQPSGFYVVFGRFGDPWKPSAGAPSTAREALVQKWALPAAQRAILDPTGTSEDYITLAADGTFTAELAVAPGGTSVGSYAIATYAGSGAVDGTQERLTPIAFATTPPPNPPQTPGTGTGSGGQTLTVTPFSGLDPAGQDLVVEGTGYDPAVGVYVALCVDNGPNLAPSPCVGGSGESSGSSSSAWITDDDKFAALRTAPFGAGGTFSATLTVTATDEFVDCYDAATTCVLTTRADHTATANRSADVKVPVYFIGQTPPVNPDPDPEPNTVASVNKTEVVAGGELTVTGDGFLPGEQVQVWLHSEPQLMGVVVADAVGAVQTTFIVPLTTEPGTHHVELYGVTSALRLVSPDFSVLAAAVPAAAAAVAASPSAPTPAPAATVATGSLPVTGSGLAAAGFGAALIALGLALAGPTRRRRIAGRGAES